MASFHASVPGSRTGLKTAKRYGMQSVVLLITLVLFFYDRSNSLYIHLYMVTSGVMLITPVLLQVKLEMIYW